MKALDTNVIVRFLVSDDQAQAEAVRQRFLQAEREGEILFVPTVVLLETLWVLLSAYALSEQDILKAIHGLTRMPILEFESRSAVQAFLTEANKRKTDLSDVLIGACAREAGCESVLTFDKKAAKIDLFELMGS